jgi:hypothetical protein
MGPNRINGQSPPDVDPNNVDVLLAKPKRGKKRIKPPIPDKLIPLAKEARVRADRRPASPGVLLEPRGKDGLSYEAPHNDEEAWELSLADAFGTRSHSAIYTFLDQLTDLCTRTWSEKSQRWKPNEQELNFLLNFVNSLRPRNEAEAALAAQMAAIHMMSMRVASYELSRGGSWVDPKNAAIASKLARTYAQQLETLTLIRGKGRSRQTIKVQKELHQHVHYHRDPAPTGRAVSGTQPHTARTIAPSAEIIEGSTTVQSDDKTGVVVPLAGRAR